MTEDFWHKISSYVYQNYDLFIIVNVLTEIYISVYMSLLS